MSECECQHWARSIDLKYLTNHHPKCSHYNDSLIDVWRVTCGGRTYYSDDEQDANDTAKSETEESGGETASIVKEKMHREVFDRLPEFDGF